MATELRMSHGERESSQTGRRVTVTDLARDAGVSRSTVSLVLRDSPLVKRETRRRVEDAIDRLGYVYNRNAANLRRRTSDMVAMVIHDLTNPFFAELAVGLEEALEAAGHVSLMANTGEDPERQRRVMETMREHGAAGFILCPAMGTDSGQAAAMADWNVPVIQVMRWLPGTRLGRVAPDYALGVRMAAEHLLALGHRRIAFLGGSEANRRHRRARARLPGRARCRGYCGGPRAGRTGSGQPRRRRGGAAARTRSRSPADGRALLQRCRRVRRAGCRGCGGADRRPRLQSDRLRRYCRRSPHLPPLTTVAVYPQELGRRSAAALLRRIADPSEAAEEEILAPSLVVRGTCGPVPKESPRR